jgi:methylenetetrahydrofolate reductase (NADPH)
MHAFPYIVELLSPKRTPAGKIDNLLDRFAGRFQQIMDAGCGVSIPDNPMGQPRLGALECIELRGLKIDSEKVIMNLNSFHTREELDHLLNRAADSGLKHILVVRGDGGPLLPRLDPRQIDAEKSVVTSVDLIRYIHRSYAGRFITAAAFNPYKPLGMEMKRMKQKMAAGAAYAVTQPIIGRDAGVDELLSLGIPVVVEAWMSTNIDLFNKSVGRQTNDQADGYDPVANLKSLHAHYPESCVYLSMLRFDRPWNQVLPHLSRSFAK